MTILFLFVSVPPLEDNHSIFASLIHQFRLEGHRVLVSSKSKNRGKTRVEIESGIPVLRVDCPEFTGIKSNVKKALAYQEYIIKQRYYIKRVFKDQKVDLVISHSLPPEIGFVLAGIKNGFKCPVYLIQTDFIWQDAVAYGYFRKSGLICRYYQFWESKLFQLADFIGCPTKGNITFIKSQYPNLDKSKFHLLPFWKQYDSIRPNYQLKEEFGLKDKFVVVYGGSVGAAQRVEVMVDLAESCQEYNDMVFLILGKGSYLDTIKRMVTKRGLKNFKFSSFLPQNQYLAFLATCDVGLVILNEKMATPNFPSKSLSYLNMRVPILAALDHVTDFGNYLVNHKAGLWAYSDDLPNLKKALVQYYTSKDLRDSTAENGYNLFRTHLTPESAYNSIMKSICQQ